MDAPDDDDWVDLRTFVDAKNQRKQQNDNTWVPTSRHIPTVDMGREAQKNWSMVKPEKAAPITGTTLRVTSIAPADSRQLTSSVRY